jgi:hypothetical protein
MLGNIGYDAVKSGVVAGLSYGVAALVGAKVAFAVAPLIVFVVIVLAVGVSVNLLDNHYKVKDKVFDCFKALPNNLPPGVYSAPGDTINALQNIQKVVSDKVHISSPISDDIMKEIYRFLDTSMRQMMRPR